MIPAPEPSDDAVTETGTKSDSGAGKKGTTARPSAVSTPSKKSSVKSTSQPSATTKSVAPKKESTPAAKSAPTEKSAMVKSSTSTTANRKPVTRKPAARKAPARTTAAFTASPAKKTTSERPSSVVKPAATGKKTVETDPKKKQTSPVSKDAESSKKPTVKKTEANKSDSAKPKVEKSSLKEPKEPKEPKAVKAVKEVKRTKAEPVIKAAAAPQPSAASGVVSYPHTPETVLKISNLHKRFGNNLAVDGVSLDVRQGAFYGIVGPNGAGKTTTLSIVTGLLRPDAGTVHVHVVDVWADPVKAKRSIGVLPDRLRLFDRLTGAQLLYYAGTLRGLDSTTVKERIADLANAFGLDDALNRLVADYSAGMTKKVALATAMIHSPRLLVLDEPFESVDPVSAANVIEILQKYVAAGGTVVLSSHGMDFIQRVCDSVAIIVNGQVLASGTVDEVRGGRTLEDRFVEVGS